MWLLDWIFFINTAVVKLASGLTNKWVEHVGLTVVSGWKKIWKEMLFLVCLRVADGNWCWNRPAYWLAGPAFCWVADADCCYSTRYYLLYVPGSVWVCVCEIEADTPGGFCCMCTLNTVSYLIGSASFVSPPFCASGVLLTTCAPTRCKRLNRRCGVFPSTVALCCLFAFYLFPCCHSFSIT